MTEITGKITSFTKLIAWQESHKLVIMIYKLTKLFPKEELFSLTNQIQRAAVSISSNIAEGFGRNSAKEKIRFYDIAHGSLVEVQNQSLIARDIGYLNSTDFTTLADQSILCQKLICGLIRSIKKTNP